MKSVQGEFPELTSKATEKKDELLRKWYLVTNQLNLFYMLAAGLIMPPLGFGNKYYKDTLEISPGWCLLFPGQVSQKAVAYSMQEASHLTSCLLELDISNLIGDIHVIAGDGKLQSASLPDGLPSDARALFVPGPLPVTIISSIIFHSKDEKKQIEDDAKDFGNVRLDAFKRSVGGTKLFKGSENDWNSARKAELPNRSVNLQRAQAIGAMMAMLSQFGNLGQQSSFAARIVFEPEGDLTQYKNIDPIIAGLAPWLRGESPNGDIATHFFWGAVDALISSQFQASSALDVILVYLERAATNLEEKRWQDALHQLAGDLRQVAGFIDSTVSELLARHTKPFSRALVLFFLLESSAELRDFKHDSLTEVDYLVASILFAAREGWRGLPNELRSLPGLSTAVPPRMAAQAQLTHDGGIGFGVMPDRPRPLRELLEPTAAGWSKAQSEVALQIAREGKWAGIQTRVTLEQGDYALKVDGRGMHFVFDGDAKAVETTIDQETFFQELAGHYFSVKEEEKLRKIIRI